MRRRAAESEGVRLEPETLSALLQEIAHAARDGAEEAWSSPLVPGQRIGSLELVRELGRGGFGVVWEARDPSGRRVALKAVRPGRRERLREERLLREAEAAARLSHPNLVTLLDAGRSEAGPYLTLELLAGRTLAERLRDGPLPVEEALRVALDVARGLAHAHAQGVVHRDLKPENVFLCDDGRVKVLDLGLAHAFGHRRAEGGTAGYMAPEQAAGAPEDERTDVYALGVLLVEMLTGERPRSRGGWLRSSSLEVRGLAALGDLVRRALEAEPVARPRDAGALVPVLEALRAEVAVRPPAPGAVRTRRRRSGALAVAAAMLVAGALVHVGGRRDAPPSPAPPVVVVADFANETGERELDHLSGLLVTALEESRRVRVVPRSRMQDVLKRLGRADVERIDEALGRDVARETKAHALLVATVRKLDDRYLVDLRAIEPVRDEHLFAVRERSVRAGLFDLVDRLGVATRRSLVRGDDLAPRPVATITTTSVAAWDHLARARQAFDRYQLDVAGKELEAALAEDPDFALARARLAQLSLWGGRGEIHGWWPRYLGPTRGKRMQRNVAEAAALADRLPDKDRLTLLAAIAWEEDRYMESLRLRDELARAFPLDKEAIFYAGDVRWHLAETGESIPYFERVLELDPGHGAALWHLATAAAASGRARELLPRLRREVASSSAPEVIALTGAALLEAGEEEQGMAALRRSATLAGYPPDEPIAQLHRLSSGRAEEVEAELRRRLGLASDRRSQDVLFDQVFLGLALAVQGRFAEASLELATTRWKRLPRGDAVLQLLLAAAPRDAMALAEATHTAERLGVFEDPALLGEALVGLAAGGDAATARRISLQIRRSPTFAELAPADRGIVGGLAAWGGGDLDGARAELVGTSRRSDEYVRYLGLLLLSSLAAERGDDGAVVTALEEARTLRARKPNAMWTYPALLHALALAHERTGDLARASERNQELLRLWRRADPAAPLFREAKALEARLASRR